ncbi:MAG: DNA polymerase III subunit gamma/tau [Bacteroidetes bacterium]|nr:DNA polymerase III subunit gamma/tau [Bacteroidota bacterium]HET6243932.1 DNA polymerase III subunit gamma/tau [Bacteroidia bacterium]
MENFIVSARKYRPSTFDTVVGQLTITSTLKNAIKNKHLAQAFLFCGPRGVGKTTCARILAKTINCPDKTSNIEACDKCDSCVSFNTGSSLNVFELDAASNNSVDDIRNLVEQVRFAPQLGTHKIYIIDEVHMLSQAAFNAFLKTLEEPPAHAIFILATTEKHKIIPTILSRCQIFDFSRIQIDDIVKHLQSIAQKENINAESDALHIIAQKADGALRDSLSMFDQIVTYTGDAITYKAVIENLNILDYDYYFKVTDAILGKDIPSSLVLFNEILDNGFDGHNFINGLSAHFRNLLVCKDEVTIKLLEVGNNIKEKYKSQAGLCQQEFLLDALNVANTYDQQFKLSKNQRLTVELALMNLCSVTTGSSLAAEKKNDLIKIIAPLSPQNGFETLQAAPQTLNNKDVVLDSNKNVESQQNGKETIQAANQTSFQTIEHGKSNFVPDSKPSKITVNKPISIKEHLASINKPEKKNQIGNNGENAQEETNSQPFNYEEFLNVWNDYADIVREQTKQNLYTTLTSRKPNIEDDYIITLLVDNDFQIDELKAEQFELLSFLKNKLKNYKLTFTASVIEVEREKKIFTSRDKYKRMSEINPHIIKLKHTLDLELDY